jgi:curved DNA-binding protein CbpA
MREIDMTRLEEMKAKNHFERLGLQRSSDISAVKLAYLKAVKLYHPDTFSSDMSPAEVKERSDIFSLILEASSTLSDPSKRAAYLAELDHRSRKMDGGSGHLDGQVDFHQLQAAKEAFRKGKIHTQARKHPEALKYFIEATTLDPTHAEAFAWRGYEKYKTAPSNTADALKDINKCISMNASIASAYYFLGYIAKAQGDKPKAILNFKKCVALDPRHIDALREIRPK